MGQKLEKNSALRSKIEAKLQAAGYTGSVYEAAYGFKNVGQFNAATNQVQNHGYSFELLKVLMTGTYVDPETHAVYRANRLPDGTVNLVSSELATNPASTLSLGQSKQAIAAGAEMPEIVVARTNTTSAPTARPRRAPRPRSSRSRKGRARSARSNRAAGASDVRSAAAALAIIVLAAAPAAAQGNGNGHALGRYKHQIQSTAVVFERRRRRRRSRSLSSAAPAVRILVG